MGKKKLTFEMEQLAKLLQGVALPAAEFDFQKNRGIFEMSTPVINQLLQHGFTPEELAALNAQAIEGTATQFEGARSSLIEELGRRGLRTSNAPVSASALRRSAELGGAQAVATSDALRNVLLANANARRENQFNALGLLQGLQGNVAGDIGAATDIANTQANLSKTRASMGGGFWKSLGSSLLGATASSFGGSLGAKLGGMIFKPKPKPAGG